MALIKCTECENDVSDRAAVCPNCGCPVSDILFDIAENEQLGLEGNQEEDTESSTTLLSVLSFLFPFVGFLFGAAYIAADDEEQGLYMVRVSTISLVIYAIGILIAILKK